ncbi:AMP-binding protein [Aestuariibacter salexigens]|uniref:AMP-binding protein n=1 Tax=Aestuariibacter salexigens TaxID=226010 RepID=UPI0003F4C461|nr:AMP-binding protein [Aestuariibacter salexigens]
MTRNVTQWTTSQVIKRQAQCRPDAIAIEFIDGPSFTYSELYRRAKSIAAGLNDIGFAAGDKLACLLPNGPEFVDMWLGCHQADGVLVALNTELIGQFLLHALNLSEASVLVCDAYQAAKLSEIAGKLTHLTTVIIIDGKDVSVIPNINVMPVSSLYVDPANIAEPESQFNNLAALIFTSGTTGPSKAVMMPHAHCYLFAQGTIDNLDLKQSNCYYICLPLFHANGLFMQLYACLVAGAKAVIRSRFSASQWLTDIQRVRATHTNLLGVMAEFIDRQPVMGNETEHNLRVIAAAPAAPAMITRFKQRFAVKMIELYGMSEVNIPLCNPLEDSRPGSCGKPYSAYFEVRIADPESDIPCAAGEVGEIQVRPKLASGFMSGYYQMPDKTVEAWRNLWFHTGDAGRCDADGYYYFVDRLKDCLRRRGENISSYEVETAINALDGVKESAVIGVPSEIPGGEEEVMAIIVADGNITAQQVFSHCQTCVPAYALPRYIRFMQESAIPRTATNKIRKVTLREQGVTTDTWDSTD